MSDPEGFLARWSRRKRDAAEQAAAADEPAAPAERGEAAAPAEREEAPDRVSASSPAPPAQQENIAPKVDLAALPSIESIGPGTDIRAFLAPGVPPDLARAALRRAWVADPAIRDFVGLAENAWDFNAPHSVGGFDAAIPVAEARRLVAQMFGNDRPDPDAARASRISAGESGPSGTEPKAGAQGQAGGPEGREQPRAPDADPPEQNEDRRLTDAAAAIDAAPQNETPPPAPKDRFSQRRHGGALPE